MSEPSGVMPAPSVTGDAGDTEGDLFAPFDPGPEPASESVTYEVVGPHRIHEVAAGGSVDLDPEAPQTRRLLESGAIRLRSHEPDTEE